MKFKAGPARPESQYGPVWYAVWWRLIRTYLQLSFRMEAMGLENLPTTGGAILVANHSSFLDVPAVACSVPRDMRFVTRDTLDEIPLLGYWIRRTGPIYIKRGEADVAAIREIVKLANGGDFVVLYPEGTRSENDAMQELKSGILLAARKANVPLIPVGLAGSFDALSRERKFPKLRGRIALSFGPGFNVNDNKDGKKSGAESLEIIRERILEQMIKARQLWESREKRPYPHPLDSRLALKADKRVSQSAEL
ncbi:MAG: lysophospholipid acyltransferase family protein [Planctomycetota bacterium]